MEIPLNRIVLNVRDIEQTVAFYETHFGFKAQREAGDRIVELAPQAGGAILMLHQLGKGQKPGQVLVKLVFDVRDVEAFCAECGRCGLTFGPLHRADGYVFANAKDPAGNTIAVSSRAFRKET